MVDDDLIKIFIDAHWPAWVLKPLNVSADDAEKDYEISKDNNVEGHLEEFVNQTKQVKKLVEENLVPCLTSAIPYLRRFAQLVAEEKQNVGRRTKSIVG